MIIIRPHRTAPHRTALPRVSGSTNIGEGQEELTWPKACSAGCSGARRRKRLRRPVLFRRHELVHHLVRDPRPTTAAMIDQNAAMSGFV